jgi:hypothetical protein
MLPTGKDKLYWLIRLFVSDHHDIRTFCREFEQTYNIEVDGADLSARERTVFGELFNKVVLYSPFPEEIKIYPAYQSAEQIRDAVRTAQLALDINAYSDPQKLQP